MGIRRIISWPRFRFKKLRILLAWIGGVVLFFNSHISDTGFRQGVPWVVIGELIRLWASGYLQKKGKQLATAGPFAHVRNPLYVGNFFIGLGVCVISRNVPFLILFLIGFGILYAGTIHQEEKELKERFGKAYECYQKEVPRFLPRLTPYPGREKAAFQWRLLLKHREQVALLGIVLLLAGLYLWEEMVVERGQFLWKEKIAIGVALAMASALAFEWILRETKKE